MDLRLRRGGVAIAVLAALTGAVPSASAAVVRPAPGDGVATCLRSSGDAGLLTVLGRLGRAASPTDLLDASSASDVPAVATTTLGILTDCAATATGGGTTVVAGVTRGTHLGPTHLRAALREGSGDFAAPVDLADEPLGQQVGEVRAAAGPDGTAVVVWTEARERSGGQPDTRVMAARRTPGGGFEAAEELVPWTRASGLGAVPHAAAGVDAAGRATVVWAQPLPDRQGVFGRSRVAAARAAAGARFGRGATIDSEAQDVQQVELAVSPGGRALVAYDGTAGIQVAERTEAAGRFGPNTAIASSDVIGLSQPAVALRDDGAAVVAWATPGNDDTPAAIDAVRRGPAGDFGDPSRVWSRGSTNTFGAGTAVIGLGGTGRATAPLDTSPLRAVIAPDGGLLLTWVATRVVGGDAIPTAYSARGTIAAGFDRAIRRSGDCRAANGIVPFTRPGEAPQVAWTDNTGVLELGLELPGGDGRLHVPLLDEPAPVAAAPPVVTASAPSQVQRLYFDSSAELTATCAGPCDLRAYVPGAHGDPHAAVSASLPAGGTKRLRIRDASLERSLAPPRPGPVKVTVRACTPDGEPSATTTATLHLARRPVPPVPKPLGVTARRSGGTVTVRWHTAFAARRVSFTVAGDTGVPAAVVSVKGSGRTRFSARLKDARSGSVTVTAYGDDPPNRHSSATAAVGR